MNDANSGNFYMCMATPDLSVIKRLIVPDIVQKFQRPFADPELGYGKINTNNSDRNTTAGTHSDQGYSLGKTKKKFTHTPPQMSCILCLKKKKKTKKIKKEQKNKKAETNKQKKMQVIFLPDSEAPPCFPRNFKGSYTIHIYVFWLAGPADQRKSLHVLVLVTNFYIANVG